MADIVVIGTGGVGVAVATSILHQGLASRLTLVDAIPGKAEGEAMDFAHAAPLLGPVAIDSVPLEKARGGDICIITASVKQRPGDQRLDLLEGNAAVLHAVAAQLEKNGLPQVAVVVTNPVDVMTELLRRRWAGRGVAVLGTGTVLDTMRLRHYLARSLHVSGESVHAWVVGEHGDSSVLLLDSARVGDLSLADFCRRAGVGPDAIARRPLERAVRGAAYDVIRRKGATSHAIGLVTARVVRALVRDERFVMPVSAPVEPGLCAGVPCVVGRIGAQPVGLPEMSAEEAAAYERSLAALREAARGIGWG